MVAILPLMTLFWCHLRRLNVFLGCEPYLNYDFFWAWCSGYQPSSCPDLLLCHGYDDFSCLSFFRQPRNLQILSLPNSSRNAIFHWCRFFAMNLSNEQWFLDCFFSLSICSFDTGIVTVLISIFVVCLLQWFSKSIPLVYQSMDIFLYSGIQSLLAYWIPVTASLYAIFAGIG